MLNKTFILIKNKIRNVEDLQLKRLPKTPKKIQQFDHD